ncbi:DUF6515 family protein [Aliikangiella sp. G2MR2-5]|uniref:DUF6515 family protein n=1 Tax=Aliikangiella sp. G2MR2-5 TaxID=2788943 RepID=UPI0018AA3C38|nr:DUF6515 family protein [Aliikangiella sp. G2MR2-5]
MQKRSTLLLSGIIASVLLNGCIVHKPHHHKRSKTVVVNKKHASAVFVLPKNTRKVVHAGGNYFIHKGHFYRSHGHGHTKIAPPTGLALQFLPEGFVKVKRNGLWIYHFDGVYLRWNARKKVYIVID